jgi:hypothetical protein
MQVEGHRHGSEDDMSRRGLSDVVDVEQPSAARIYDYLLGGSYNFEVDRRVGEQTKKVYPGVVGTMWANRAFLRRAVEYLVGAGVRQFLDVGSGIPTVGHVHEVAQAAAPDAHVVYVDIDPVAVNLSRKILTGNDRTAVIQEDVRAPERILDHPDLRALIDLDQPVALLVVALFHFIPERDDPTGLIGRLTAPLVSGSYLALSHATEDGIRDDTETAKAKEIYRRSGIDVTTRTRAQVMAMFDEFDLVEPGLVRVTQWRPEADVEIDDSPASSANYAGVGRKP